MSIQAFSDKKWSVIIKLFLIVVFSLSVLLTSTAGESHASAVSPITYNANDMALKTILEKISKQSGYEIDVSPPWDDKVLTVSFDKVELEEALKKILRLLDQPSNVIIFDETNKKITILISDSFSNYASKASAPVHSGPDSDVSNIPPSDAGAGAKGFPFSAADLSVEAEKIRKLQAKQQESFTTDTVVVPSLGPEGSGLTAGRLENIKKAQNQPLPADAVIIPPSAVGETGLTASDLEAIKISLTNRSAKANNPANEAPATSGLGSAPNVPEKSNNLPLITTIRIHPNS